MFWPNVTNNLDCLTTITPSHAMSLGGSNAHLTPASGTWGFGANTALFVPFRISREIIVQNLFTMNGTVVAGNIDIGIYTGDGTRLISTGSTAQAGTSVLQTISITSTPVGPGLYYMALAASSTSARFLQQNYSANGTVFIIGLARQTSAFPLPATATFASVSASVGNIPMFGLTARSFV